MIFEAGNETHEKIGVILVLNKGEDWSEKRVASVHTAVFERARNSCVKKISLCDRKFFLFTCGFLQFFATFDGCGV